MEISKIILGCASLLLIGFSVGVLVMSMGCNKEIDEANKEIAIAQARIKRSPYNKVENEN
jgi:hypothetical protein